jgi:acyl-CoA synthetase (AMP-forming)/AMP-acid ligase II
VCTLAQSLARQAALRPHHPAIVCEDRRVDYAGLHAESNRTAHALRRAGVGPGARVAYLGRESEHYYEIVYACAKAGAVLVPVNWRLTADEVDHILRDSGAGLLFVEGEFAHTAERISAAAPDLATVVPLDSAGQRAAGLAAWKAGAPEHDLPGPQADGGDPVVQIYTSGTTGLPKGVVLANRCFFAFQDSQIEHGLDWMRWGPDDLSLVALPGFQIAGLSWTVQCLNAGVTSVVMRMFVSETALDLIERLGVTATFIAPSMLQMLLAEPRASKAAFSSLRSVAYGGSPISDTLLRQCLEMIGCRFLQVYASTEAGNVVTCLPPDDHVPGSARLRSAGRPCPYVELKIVDRDGGALGAGETGEVCVRTTAQMLEYWRQPEQTAATLADGWLHTGDAGHLDTDGYLYIGDRIKDLVIVAGQNIYPAEIENALCRHPEVAEAAVLGVPDERWGEALHACVVLRPGGQATSRELMLSLRGRIADYKIPARYEFMASLPRNPAGKIMRRQLRERFWTGLDRKVN